MNTLLLALVVLGGEPAQDRPIRLGTLAPEGSPWHNILRDMTEDWKKGTEGKVKSRIYAGGVLGDEPDMVRRMRVGQLDAAALTGVGLSEIAPEVMALQMPMMIQTYEELDYVTGKVAIKLEAILKEKGYIVLNWADAGWVHFFGQKPIVQLEDLKAAKLFVWSTSGTDVAVWKDAGANPVPLAATDIHTGLKSGLINAFSTTPLAALSFQWFGSAKHMTDLRWAPLVGATVMTKKKWDEIPEGTRPALLKAALAGGDRMRKETRKLGDDAVDVMKKHGLVVHEVPPDALKKWEEQARAAWPKIQKHGNIPASIVAEIEKHRDDFRASLKKQEGK